jgi:hypothetical protein
MILIEILYRRFNEDRFNSFIDRDRCRNDAHCTINYNFRVDFDSDNNDCIRSFTRFDVINTFIMILFQLNQTRKLVNVLYDVEFWKHYVLQSIKHFFLTRSIKMIEQIHLRHKTLKFISKHVKFDIFVYLNQSNECLHRCLHFIEIDIHTFQIFKNLIYD